MALISRPQHGTGLGHRLSKIARLIAKLPRSISDWRTERRLKLAANKNGYVFFVGSVRFGVPPKKPDPIIRRSHRPAHKGEETEVDDLHAVLHK